MFFVLFISLCSLCYSSIYILCYFSDFFMFFIYLCSLCYSPIFYCLCYSSTFIMGMCYEDRNRQIFFLSLFPISYSHLSPRIPRSSHADMLKGEKEKETQQSVFASQPIKLFKNYLTVIDRQTLSRERT